MSAHRALPLDEVERRARESRVAWIDSRAAATLHTRFPHCNGACEAGRSQCECRPAAGFDAPEFLADPVQRIPPAYPWRAIGGGFAVALVAPLLTHLVLRALPFVAEVAQR